MIMSLPGRFMNPRGWIPILKSRLHRTSGRGMRDEANTTRHDTTRPRSPGPKQGNPSNEGNDIHTQIDDGEASMTPMLSHVSVLSY